MNDWKVYKLKDFAGFSQGIQIDVDNQFSERCEGSVRFLRIVDFTKRTDNEIRYIINPGERYLVKSDDLVMIRYGSQTAGKIVRGFDGAIANNLIKISLDETVAEKHFIYYYLSQQTIFDFFLNSQSSSAMPAITFGMIGDLQIELPHLHEQTAISSILSSIDNKIDLLQRQNSTLEKMADILFRQWYIKEAKEEWREGKLSDLISIKYGKDHKKLRNGKIPVYGSGGLFRFSDKALYEKESVLIPRKGTLTNVMFQDQPFWTVDTMFYTEMKKANIAKFIFHFVKGLDLASMNVGSAVPSMTTEVLNNIPIDIPTDLFFKKFEEAVKPFYMKLIANQTQIRTLTGLRDSLLPKLMSGEVRVQI
jgi:type I restriction enzyme S subunit